jgi:hypothetical protein
MASGSRKVVNKGKSLRSISPCRMKDLNLALQTLKRELEVRRIHCVQVLSRRIPLR